jgi:hypothetical protein
MCRCAMILMVLTLAAGVCWAQAGAGGTGRAQSTLAILNQRVPEVNVREQPLRSVLEWLADFAKINLVVKWPILQDAGIDPDKPITLKVKGLRFSQVLWMILNEAAGPDVRLAYRAAGPVLTISTHDDLGKEMVTRIYDLRDLLVGIARFEAPQMDPGQALSQVGTSTSGGTGQNLFRGQQSQRRGTTAEGTDQTPEMRRLIEIIQQTIEPDSWQVNNGKGTIHDFNGMLIVYNTLQVHQQIGGFVEELELGQ